MKTPLLILGALILVCGIWLGGVRIIVVQPIGAIPDGVTAVVVGIRGPNFIDSPDAICMRNQGSVNLICRGATAAAIAGKGNIWLRLPYSSWLYALTGAPDTVH